MRIRSFIVLGAILAMPACRGDLTEPGGSPAAPLSQPTVPAVAGDSVILMVAGDMHANCKIHGRRSKATAAIVKQYPQALVIPLGDNAGYHATQADYFECYERTWGEFKSRTYATIGNHESNQDPAATAYYDYFNGVGVDSGRAGHRGRGYYTLDYGAWRIFVANNNQNVADQTAWMTRELATSPTCTMAIWHRPLFTSSAEPSNAQKPGPTRPWWRLLYDAKAELVLHGHIHSYERFAPLTPDGIVDTARGIREFVVGTGGSGLYDFNAVPRVGSQKRLKAWGVLKLTLWPTRYKWQFIDTTGAVLDRGKGTCR